MATLNTSPEQAGDAWASGLSGKVDKIKRGIDAVQTSPGDAAARQADVWLANVSAARDKFARNVRVPLGDWQTAAKAGADRIAAAAQAKKDKYVQRVTPVFAHIAAGMANLPPRGSYEQNKARMNQFVDHMHSYQRR